jgi:hypothetical protein
MSGPILQSGLALAKKELAKIPPNKTIAVVAGVQIDGTVYAGTAIRLKEEWVFDAEFEKEQGKKPSFMVGITFMK